MIFLLPALAVAFAALCVWLTVRIVNRRERWAKWTAGSLLVGLPVLYLASFGPVCLLFSREWVPNWASEPLQQMYAPLLYVFELGPAPVADALAWYVSIWGGAI